MNRITILRMPVLLPEDQEAKMPAARTQPTRVRINVNDAWCEALFASPLQPSDSPTAGMADEAANWALRQLGVHGCAGRMAQEFGDHPDAAASRMRWARQLAQAAREVLSLIVMTGGIIALAHRAPHVISGHARFVRIH